MPAAVRLELGQPGRTIPEQIALARELSAAGWQGAWISELAGPDGITQAAVTGMHFPHGRLGTAILPIQTRNPLLMAMSAASLSQLMDGKFILGLGTSTKVIVENWHGTAWGSSPIGLAREYVGILRRLLAGERVTADGPRWKLSRAQMTVAPPGPVPIYLAALNDRMLELAGEIADGVLLNFATIADVQHARGRIEAGAQRAGRSLEGFETVAYFRATTTADFEAVRERYRSEFLTYVMAPVYQQFFGRQGQRSACLEVERLWRAGERETALATIPDDLMLGRSLVGTATQIMSRLAEYGAAGIDAAIVTPIPIPTEDFMDECTRMIRELGSAATTVQPRPKGESDG